MSRRFVSSLLSVPLLLSCALAGTQNSRQGGQVLTNSSVVKLVRAGFREKTVIAIIRTRPSRFDLSPDRLIELKKNGVGERIILAMIGHDLDSAVAATDDDDWGDDALFRQGLPGGQGGAGADPGGTNIFGSSGGSRGSVRQNGVGGGSEGETVTTGSATVRIIRPPAEGGGAGAGAPKLERTPTLTNDAVVGLVEAGFSEGTIVRRIEQSPADFDLAEAKLAELRKRRVSEPVIAAMKAAMSDDAAPARPEN